MSTKHQILTYTAILAFILFIFLYLSFVQHQPAQVTSVWPSTKPSRFLVMIQTDKCPNGLTAKDIFGDKEKCNCDVLILTFKEKCLKPPPSTHIEYIFQPGTTWNTGRNLMLEVGRNRTERYLYYIFIDDDIKLTTELKNANPFWTFLEFLSRVEPAVGVVDYTWNIGKTRTAMKKLGCSENVTMEYLNSPNFDSAFNAFHYQAVGYILPYPTTFDNISWWWSGTYVKIMCDLVFPGHTVALSMVNMINPQHRPYPRKFPHDMDSWGIIMKEVEAHLPKEYLNSRLFKDWKAVGYTNEEKSISHCFPHPSPHAPLAPYSYLESSYYSGYYKCYNHMSLIISISFIISLCLILFYDDCVHS